MIESLPPYISAQVKRFEAAGIDQGQAEMELILCHVLDCNRMDLYLHGAEKLDDSALSRIEEVVKRRLTRYPLQFILNEAWFYGRRFYVTPDVMAPTPETELLCEQAMGFVRLKQIEKPKILDLGVGSGVTSGVFSVGDSVIWSVGSPDADGVCWLLFVALLVISTFPASAFPVLPDHRLNPGREAREIRTGD